MQCDTFTISAGVHQGATFAANDGLLVIGADPGCDVCLSDAGLASRHAAIMSHSGVLSIRKLDGEVSIDGRDIKGACVSLANGAEIALGASGVCLRLGDAPAKPSQAKPTQHRLNPPRALAIGTLVVVATVIVAVFSGGTFGAARPAVAKAPDAAFVHKALQRAHLDRDIKITAVAGRLQLSGVVPATSEETFRSTIANLSVSSTVVTDADLLEQVREVFRTNGYEANVSYAGNARVHIDNLDPGHERVRKAVARARTDVASLDDIEFAAAVGEPPANLPTYPARFADPLSVHVEGDIAYLSAGSRARYFVGSQLPDGARVQRIATNAVLIDRNGQRSWFAF